MRRRLEIARGLMHRPQILFLDEPTTGLDPASRIAMWELIGQLKTQVRVTVFLTTHYMEEADQLCDRVAIFDHGRVVALDTPAALKATVGGGDTIEVSFGVTDARWVQGLGTLPGVLAVHAEGATWRLSTASRVQTLEALLGRARQAAVPIASLTVRGSSLDDVFLNYTGRGLRDAADGKGASTVQMFYDKRAL
jgi:ABC-2 type transport system ATP-binding protein